MEWIVSLATLIVLVVFIIIAFTRRSSREKLPAILLFFAFLVYHVGDMGLWYGYDYELVRRFASVGFYLIMPLSLWLMYVMVPKEKMNLFIRIVTLVLILPWVYALVMIQASPLVFLEEFTPEPDENFSMMLVLAFVVAAIFAVIAGFRAAKFREGCSKCLPKNFSWGLIIYTVLILCLFMSIDLVGYDATWMFGVPTVIYTLLILLGLGCKPEAVPEA